MAKIPVDIISSFLKGKRLTDAEYDLLENLFNNPIHQKELHRILENHWHKSPPIETKLDFEEIRQNIKHPLRNSKIRFISILTRAAAILLIPVIAALLFFYSARDNSDGLLTLTTQKGEVTNVILPDGSSVWLNVDSKLSYPITYGKESRNLELEGEAYFEVEKNEELPFTVTSGMMSTTALGTRFVVSAYPESSILSSSLIEGSVKINIGDNQKIIAPGQQLAVDKNKNRFIINLFNEESELAWKNNQLVFQLTPFENVINVLEKWYDINFEYIPELFIADTLTVRFERYESMENVLKVLSRAVGFEYKVEENNIKISKANS